MILFLIDKYLLSVIYGEVMEVLSLYYNVFSKQFSNEYKL